MKRTTETSSEIVARSGSNLAFALNILPAEKREDMEVFYGFCRVIDDIADEPDAPITERKKHLDSWRNLLSQPDPLPGIETEFTELAAKYDLDRDILSEIISGVEIDLEPVRFQTADDLKKYCFKVACAVGLISIEIFGFQNPQTRQYAERLGYALQWTNIMRDVGEDAAESRIYLPLDDLERFGIKESEILENNVAQTCFQELMAHQSLAAREFYNQARNLLPPEDENNMRSPELMRRIYFGILQKMENDNYRVFEKRYRLSKVRMLSEFLRAKYLS